jgi:hypothetical protein
LERGEDLRLGGGDAAARDASPESIDQQADGDAATADDEGSPDALSSEMGTSILDGGGSD